MKTSISHFSPRSESIPEALSIYINELVFEQKRKGIDLTTLSLGEAFFDIPKFDFSAIDFVKGYHYSDSQGLPKLRNNILNYYRDNFKFSFNGNEDILITAGSKIAIYLAIIATVQQGSEVLIHEPAWLSYQEQIRLVDGIPKFIPFDCLISDFEDFFTNKTSLLVINNPNNPVGRLYTNEELQTLNDICKKNGVWLLVDEAYSDFLEPGLFKSALSFDKSLETTIVVNSLSKNMGMSGWRIGYVIAHKNLIREILKLNQHLITCAPTILQLYLIKYFDDILSITLPQARDTLSKRNRIMSLIDKIGLDVLPGSATFYFFINIKDYPNSSYYLSLFLLYYHKISTVPGSAYGISTERFLRISIGTESEERIYEALKVIKSVLNKKADIEDKVNKFFERNNISHFNFIDNKNS